MHKENACISYLLFINYNIFILTQLYTIDLPTYDERAISRRRNVGLSFDVLTGT